MSFSASCSSEANPGVWPAGNIALPTARHLPDGTHIAPGQLNHQGPMSVTI